jgi:hypothetical protein
MRHAATVGVACDIFRGPSANPGGPPPPTGMTSKFAILLLAAIAVPARADDRAKIKNGTYPDHQKAWDKFAIQGVKLGVPLESVKGFTCGPKPGTGGYTTADHSCVKFIDPRCKGRKTKIHHISSTGDVPKGQYCFMDESNGATYLDREYMAPPLQAIRIVGTDTTAPLVYEIQYTFAADDLTTDSNLGKALTKKYGAPSYTNEPIAMGWTEGDASLSAACRTIGGDHAADGEYCTIIVEDDTLARVERDIQDQANDDARAGAAPDAPEL